MYIKRSHTKHMVTLSDGSTLSRADLPDPNTRRWVASRKAVVAQAVDSGLLDPEEACELYELSHEELSAWRNAISSFGVGALKTTTLQKYRQIET